VRQVLFGTRRGEVLHDVYWRGQGQTIVDGRGGLWFLVRHTADVPEAVWFLIWVVVCILVVILLALLVHHLGGASLMIKLGHFYLNIGVT
jgi:hypothetical protein